MMNLSFINTFWAFLAIFSKGLFILCCVWKTIQVIFHHFIFFYGNKGVGIFTLFLLYLDDTTHVCTLLLRVLYSTHDIPEKENQ